LIHRPSIRDACELDRDPTEPEVTEILAELVDAGVLEVRRNEDGEIDFRLATYPRSEGLPDGFTAPSTGRPSVAPGGDS